MEKHRTTLRVALPFPTGRRLPTGSSGAATEFEIGIWPTAVIWTNVGPLLRPWTQCVSSKMACMVVSVSDIFGVTEIHGGVKMAMDMLFMGQARANARVANANAQAADDWAAYAHRLEQLLLEANAREKAVNAVKDAALAELARVDPRNYLLVQKNRQALGNAAYYEALEERKAS